jgi:hypothetical protein
MFFGLLMITSAKIFFFPNTIVKKRKFNDNEIKILEEEFRKNKFKWAEIARKLPDTSPLMVKNFYYNKLRKRISNKVKVSNNTDDYKLFTLATIADDISGLADNEE